MVVLHEAEIWARDKKATSCSSLYPLFQILLIKRVLYSFIYNTHECIMANTIRVGQCLAILNRGKFEKGGA
jgi:hypothetical protein